MNNQICIIAEKPSVAREIARIVGATERAEGYLKGNRVLCNMGFRSSGHARLTRRVRHQGIPPG